MESVENAVTRYEGSEQRELKAPEERRRMAQTGEQLASVPELQRALATHYAALGHLVNTARNEHALDLVAMNNVLRATNAHLDVVTTALMLIVQRSAEVREYERQWWRQPWVAAAAATWLLAGSILGALMNRP